MKVKSGILRGEWDTIARPAAPRVVTGQIVSGLCSFSFSCVDVDGLRPKTSCPVLPTVSASGQEKLQPGEFVPGRIEPMSGSSM